MSGPRYASASVRGGRFEEALDEAADRALADLNGTRPDLAFLFVSPAHGPSIALGGGRLLERTAAAHLVGCTGVGVCETAGELEQGPVLSLLLASLPGAALHPFAIGQDELDALREPGDLRERIGADPDALPAFVLLTDPFSLDTDTLLERIVEAYPDCAVTGGLASGGVRPGMHQLYCDGSAPPMGAVGIALSGTGMRAVVSQGCRPVGRRFVITRCHDHTIQELSGKPALEAIQGTVEQFEGEDQRLARENLLIGRVSHEAQDDFRRGDFLIRPILGVLQDEGAVVVGERVRVGQTVQLQVRDAATAAQDLDLELGGAVAAGGLPGAALLFSCAGRGTNLFPDAHHDVAALKQHAGDIPVSGFFCNGEIGTVGGRAFVHGFTASLALF